jgi:hypothetical protein
VRFEEVEAVRREGVKEVQLEKMQLVRVSHTRMQPEARRKRERQCLWNRSRSGRY